MQNWSVALEETHCLQQEKKCHHGTVCAAAITTPPFAASKAPPTAKAQIEVPSLVIKYFLRAATFQNFYRETTNPPLHTAKDEETASSKAEGSLQIDRSSKMNAISMKLYERLALMYSLTCTPTCSFILYLIKLVTALFHRSQTISFSWGNHFLCQMNYQKNWNKPKEYPNSNDMMGRFQRTGFLWSRHVNNSRSFDPRRSLGDKCKAQLAELKKQPFTPKSAGDPETNVQNSLWLQRTFWEALLQKNRRQTCHFAPRPLLWLKTPKLTLFGKNAKKSWRKWETNVKNCKEVMGEPSAEPFRKRRGLPQKTREINLRKTLVEPSAEPFGSPRRICPREP